MKSEESDWGELITPDVINRTSVNNQITQTLPMIPPRLQQVSSKPFQLDTSVESIEEQAALLALFSKSQRPESQFTRERTRQDEEFQKVILSKKSEQKQETRQEVPPPEKRAKLEPQKPIARLLLDENKTKNVIIKLRNASGQVTCKEYNQKELISTLCHDIQLAPHHVLMFGSTALDQHEKTLLECGLTVPSVVHVKSFS
jgi:hypothetical protein